MSKLAEDAKRRFAELLDQLADFVQPLRDKYGLDEEFELRVKGEVSQH